MTMASSIVLEVSTKDYENDREQIKKIIEELQSFLQIEDGYALSDPMSRFGWTFFKILFKNPLVAVAFNEFPKEIDKCEGKYPEQKFASFMSRYFESKNCSIRMKLIE